MKRRETERRRNEAAVKPLGSSPGGIAARTTNESLSPDETPAIRTDGPARILGSLTTVNHLDLETPTGIVYGLSGPNGAGRPTTLRMMTTLLAPTRGRAMVLGHDAVRERHAVHGPIGVTRQYASVDEILTGSENLRLFGRLLGLGRRRVRERAEKLLAVFSLTGVGDKRVSRYSDRMRWWLGLAVSLTSRPSFVFLDEPTTGLDLCTREQMWDVIRSLVGGSSAILLTIQYLKEADRLTHWVGIIDARRLIIEDTPDEFKDRVGNSSLVLTPAIPEDRAATAAVIERVAGHVLATVDQDTHLQAPLSEASMATEVLAALRDAGLSPRVVSVDRPSMDLVFMALAGQPTGHGNATSPNAAAPSVSPPASSSSRLTDSQGQS